MARHRLIQVRRGISSAWSSANPILAGGEPGWDSDNGMLKIGDGVTAWDSLAAAGGWVVTLAEVNTDTAVDFIDLVDIPQTYRLLRLTATLRSDRAASDADGVAVQFNGDSTDANYDYQVLTASASTAASSFASNAAAGLATASTADAGRFGHLDMLIPDYAGANLKVAPFTASRIPTVASANKQFRSGVFSWLDTDAITSIRLNPTIGTNFIAGCTVTLQGLS